MSVYPNEMVSSHPTGCLEPEVVAAYVDHGLSLVERAQVETHLASCRECTALLAGVVRTVADISAFIPDAGAAEATPPRTSRPVLVALSAAAAVFAVLVVPPFVGPWLERDAGLVSLVDSVGEQRSVLGRLTGGFPHAPLRVSSAGGQDGQAAETDRVLLTAGRIRESVGELATPSALHALGVSQLLAGRHDDAVQSLLAASREQPANAQYLSDVAAVQLERARLGLRPDDLPRALAAADRARRLDPSLNEAWFNRALAMSALSLTDQARTAWTEYLRRDSVSPWATEARARLEELARPTPAAAWAAIEGRLEQSIDAASADAAVRAQTTEARNFIENELFVNWANAVLAGNSGAAELDRARVMAEAMLRVAGDALYRDAVTAIEHADAGRARALAAAHLGFAQASALFVNDRFGEAASQLTAVHRELTNAGSPFAVRAGVDLGATSYVSNNYGDALTRLSAARSIAESKGYAYVRARTFWFEGVIAFAQSRLGDAQSHYEDTLAVFEQMGDAEQVVAAHTLLASLHYYLGDKQSEWRHRRLAFEGLAISRSPRLKFQVFLSAAASVRAEQPETALLLQDAALETLQGSGRSTSIFEVLTSRANTLLAMGRVGEAASAIAAAREQLNAVTDPSFRQLFELLILAPEGELQRRRNAPAAVATAERALNIIDQRNSRADRSRLAQFQLQLAKANIVSGRLEEAESALAKGIRAFDEERAVMSDEGRLSTSDESWQLFDTAVQLAIRKGDHRRAFAMAERARARTLAEAKRAPATRSVDDIQSDLGTNEAVIALNQFEDELAIWVIRRERFDVVMRPLTRLDTQKLVARQQTEIWQESLQANAGRDLYNEIIRPVSAQLRGASSIVFVPDAAFEHASFAAFYDVTRRRFLVEDVRLSLAPSVDSYVGASRTTAATSNTLILGGPVEAANAKARAVAAVYPSSSVVTGTSATGSRLFESAAAHSVVHLAARTSPNQSHPLLSRIWLADEPGRRHSGAILGRDIAARQMAQTSLVVIDEVEAANTNRGEGTLGLARAFLAAGVPAVLGTLPGADESATRDLMVGFHRRMAASMAPADALTEVQRNALQQNGGRLGAWTALVIYGSER